MEFVENPRHPYERKLDHQLKERTESWGPQFMLMLVETYRAYLAGGRKVVVPAKVGHNLEEQREENDPFPTWFQKHMKSDAEHKLHVHRILERFNPRPSNEGAQRKQETRALTMKLKNMRIQVAQNQRRLDCPCKQSTTYVIGYNFKSDDDPEDDEDTAREGER